MFKDLHFPFNTPSTTWTVTHNLGVSVNADVLVELDGVLQKGYPANMTQNAARTTLTITWTLPRTGRVRVIAVVDDDSLTSNPSWVPDDVSNT